MPRKAAPVTFETIAGALVQSLRSAAQRPSIHGYHPMDHQIKFHKSPAKGRAFIGGNRSGKTVGGAAESTFYLTGKHPYQATPEPPCRMRGVSADWPHGLLQIMLPELAKWIPPSFLVNGSWEDSYNKTEKVLTLNNGSSMDFPTHEMPLIKHAGTSRHGIWFDEEPPKAIFNENMARLIDTGGKWWLTETPVEGMTWVYDDIFIKSRTDPNIFVIEVSMDDNTYLSTVEIEMLISLMDEDEKLARRQGKFVQIGGLIYKQFGPQNVIAPLPVGSEEFSLMLKHWTFFNGVDAGYNNPTAWLWAAVNNDGVVIVFDEHYASGMLVKDHAEIVKETNRKWGIDPIYNVGDPSMFNSDPLTGTSVGIEYTLAGVPIIPGNNDVNVGLQVVATAFKNHTLFFTSNCEKSIWEHSRYRWATYSSRVLAEKRNVQEKPNKKDDHTCDTVRYMLCSRPEHIEKVTKAMDKLGGLAPSLPPTGERFARIHEEEQLTYVDPWVGSEF